MFIEFIGVTLVNKITQVLGVQHSNTPSAYCTVCPRPKVNGTLSCKEKKILPYVTARMHPESTTLSEIGPSEKDKYRVISLMCGI